ncbi:MAG: MBL fold metallo-hydrolase [Clostridia bacterium]|nr:MBL fold metallo-hydrolase [Clostridia bacterium]
MLKFCSLFSGSSGNSLFVESNKTKLLVDCGESAKKIVNSLSDIDVNIEDINGILVTHEHIDHVKSLGTLSRKYNLPVYTNKETLNAMPDQMNKIKPDNIRLFDLDKEFIVGDLKIHPFAIPHDAANPCAFNIFKNDTKISIATDIGHITPEIIKNLEKSAFLLLEANYDPNILKCSPYPYHLKERIAGPLGHLSNNMAGETVSHLIDTGLKTVMLGHLSRENNFPELAYKTVMEEIIYNNYPEKSINLSVATRFEHTPIINIK